MEILAILIPLHWLVGGLAALVVLEHCGQLGPARTP